MPLVGTRHFGLINFPFSPEMAPFFDAGLMWTSDQRPVLRSPTRPTRRDHVQRPLAPNGICAERIPVFSAGVTFRSNVLGYLILETYLAKPFQRPPRWGAVDAASRRDSELSRLPPREQRQDSRSDGGGASAMEASLGFLPHEGEPAECGMDNVSILGQYIPT